MRALRVLLSIVMLCTLMFVAQAMRSRWVEHHMIVAVSAGFLMLGAWLMGHVFARLQLPRISGYLVFGLLVGPSLWDVLLRGVLPTGMLNTLEHGLPLVSDPQVHDLHFIKDLAISLIAITAGGEIRIGWLRGQIKRVAALTAANVFGVALIVTGAVLALQPVLGIIHAGDPAASSMGASAGGITTTGLIIAASLLGLIASGNSPSVAIAMMNECEADGPLSRTTLAVTVCKDLTIIVLFAALVSLGKGLVDADSKLSAMFLLAVGAQLGGSLVLGAAMGLVMAWYVSRVRAHLVFFVIGACFVVAILGEQKFAISGLSQAIHLEPLLMALAAGLVMENFKPQQSAPLFETIEHLSLPIYCLFFAVAGAEMDLSIFTVASAAIAVAAVVVIRAAAIWLMIRIAGRGVKLDEKWRGKLWLALTPQAGVTLALATLMTQSFAEAAWSKPLGNLLLGTVIVHALCGPIAYRRALISSGEAGAAVRKK